MLRDREAGSILPTWTMRLAGHIDALLAAIDELTAQRDAALGDASREYGEARKAWLDRIASLGAENDQLTAQLDAVRALHREYDDDCNSRTWPCETVRALTKAVQ